MKLLRYTNTKLTLLLLFLIGIWGVFFYFAIHHEIMDETDDMLRSYRDIFIKKALHNPDLLNLSYETTFDRYSILPITDEEAEKYEESWLNREVFFPEYDEHIPVRVYKSIFLAADSQYYELEISMSTMERDDMIETLIFYLIFLYTLLLVCIIVGNRVILKKSFIPLQKLLFWLDSIIPGKPVPALNNETSILEFQQLNEATMAMSQRNLQAYEQQKQFIENASHELQTPLAIALNKIELFAQNQNLTEKQLDEIDTIYQTLNKTVKLNKSLLLLSRIENEQFQDVTEINVYELLSTLANDFIEIYEDKRIDFKIEKKVDLNVRMNEQLSQILFSNLLKNAFVHTPKKGKIIICIDSNILLIKNTGIVSLDERQIFNRFYHKSENKQNSSTGLGLSIAKSICTACRIELQYKFEGEHLFLLKFTN